MNNAEIYEMIPFQVLERVGFPTNYIQLSLDQKFFVDCVFNNSRDIFSENLRMQDKIYHLEDKVADLQHELKDLAGKMSNQIKFVGLHAHSVFSVFDGLGYPQDHIDYAIEERHGCLGTNRPW